MDLPVVQSHSLTSGLDAVISSLVYANTQPFIVLLQDSLLDQVHCPKVWIVGTHIEFQDLLLLLLLASEASRCIPLLNHQ